MAGLLVRLAGSVLLATAAWSSTVVAHEGAPPLLVVPYEQVRQGESFPVFAVDLQPSAPAQLSLARGDEMIDLATARADGFGHFETTLTIPVDYADGYAELIAVSSDGTRASTWLLVGAGAGVPPPTTPGVGSPAGWFDPSVIVLAVLVIGAVLLVGWQLRPRAR